MEIIPMSIILGPGKMLESLWHPALRGVHGAEGLSVHKNTGWDPLEISQHGALALPTNLRRSGGFISSNQWFPWLQMENRGSSMCWWRGKKEGKGGKSSPRSRHGQGGHGGGRGDGYRREEGWIQNIHTGVFCLIPDLFNLWDVPSRTGTFYQLPGIPQHLDARCSKGNG